MLGWVHVVVVVAVGLDWQPKGGLFCGGPPLSHPACSSLSPHDCDSVPASARVAVVGDGNVLTMRGIIVPVFVALV